jgi:hypothetical protein
MEWNGRKSLGIKTISTFSLNGRARTRVGLNRNAMFWQGTSVFQCEMQLGDGDKE